MGLFDKMKEKALDTTKTQLNKLETLDSTNIVKGITEKVGAIQEQKKLDGTEIMVTLTDTSKPKLFASKNDKREIFIRKDGDGYYYFSKKYDNSSERFLFENYFWNGSTYTSTTIANTQGSINQKGRSGSALVGGLLAGPAGAIIGSSRGKKSKVDTTTTSNTTKQELGSDAKITFKSANTGEIKNIQVYATQSINDNLLRFLQEKEIEQEYINNDDDSDDLEQLKKYKELLDAEIITQEDFDAKKKQILGL
jgi:hypothetical protein